MVQRPGEFGAVDRQAISLFREAEDKPRRGAIIHRADAGVVPEIDVAVMRVPLAVVERQAGFKFIHRLAKPSAKKVRRPAAMISLQQDLLYRES